MPDGAGDPNLPKVGEPYPGTASDSGADGAGRPDRDWGNEGPGDGEPGRRWEVSSWPCDALGRALSPWWRRAVAIILDWLIVGIPAQLFISALGLSSSVTTSHNQLHISNAGAYFEANLIQLALLLAYFAFLDGSERGQTLGKMLLRISTRDAHTGGPIGHTRALARRLTFVLLFLAFLIPGLVNALWPAWARSRQAWHDKVGGSVVVEVS